jgi:L-type amino acid transporter 9
LGSANAILFEAARYCMVGAQYGYLPELFACIQTQRLTPLPGVVLQVLSSIEHFRMMTILLFFFLKGLVAIIFCIPSNIYGLIDFFSFAAWIFYGLTFVATLCCKFTKKDAHRVISVCSFFCEQVDR